MYNEHSVQEKFESLGFTSEEIQLAKIVLAAREIQTFLWSEVNGEAGFEEWRRMFRKRVAKMDAIDPGHMHAAVEMRKRVLQVGALAVGFLHLLMTKGVTEAEPGYVSNLPQHSEPVKEFDSSTFFEFLEKSLPRHLGSIADDIWRTGRGGAVDHFVGKALKNQSSALHDLRRELDKETAAFKRSLGVR